RSQPPDTLRLLGLLLLRNAEEVPLGIEVLRLAQQQYPADFWTNLHLGIALREHGAGRPGEVAGFYRAAVALRPRNPGARVNLSYALIDQRRAAEAETHVRVAIGLKADFAGAHVCLGHALRWLGKLPEAAVALREAIRLRPRYFAAQATLGEVLRLQGDLPG